MKWTHDTWTIKKFMELYLSKKINLSPEYQRNPIWTSKAQKLLIDTILIPQPMPNFFLLRTSEDTYEMVDGQQRARSIIDYSNGHIKSSNGISFKDTLESFNNYCLNMIIINELSSDESIEAFYTLVNSSGLRLNSPELKKAQYYNTKFLALNSELAASEKFTKLDLFGSGTIDRMNDVELVSELLALLLYGCTEKKEEVEKLYEKDISEDEVQHLRKDFDKITNVLSILNSIYPLKKTRYKQRADLYTLFDFINKNNLQNESYITYYNILLQIEKHIRPTQEDCIPLRDYARNCVSQSNSKNARIQRSEFMSLLFRNPVRMINEIQKDIVDFFKLKDDLIEIEEAWTIDINSINEVDEA